MRIGKKIKILVVIVLCVCMGLSVTEGVSAKKNAGITTKNYSGTYYMKKGAKCADENNWSYNVVIDKIASNGKVKFYIEYLGTYCSPIYCTEVITGKIKGNKVSFKWSDSWGNKGKGTIKFVKKHQIKLNMKTTKWSENNRASLDTDGDEIFTYYKKDHDVSQFIY